LKKPNVETTIIANNYYVLTLPILTMHITTALQEASTLHLTYRNKRNDPLYEI
jgi:hypothetical protein